MSCDTCNEGGDVYYNGGVGLTNEGGDVYYNGGVGWLV